MGAPFSWSHRNGHILDFSAWQPTPGGFVTFHFRAVVLVPIVEARFCILNHVEGNMSCSSEIVCQGCGVSTGSQISNTFPSLRRQECFIRVQAWHALGFSFFSFLPCTRQGSRHAFRHKFHRGDRSRGTTCISIKVENSRGCSLEVVSQSCVVIDGAKTLNLFASMHT